MHGLVSYSAKCLSQVRVWISNIIFSWSFFLCSVSYDERWLFVLLIIMELLTLLIQLSFHNIKNYISYILESLVSICISVFDGSVFLISLVFSVVFLVFCLSVFPVLRPILFMLLDSPILIALSDFSNVLWKESLHFGTYNLFKGTTCL
jgi:hypothetical protein